MAHPIHKIVGPLFNQRTPPTVAAVTQAVHVEGVGYRCHHVVAEEWINEAKRKNGQLTDAQKIGRAFRERQRERRRARSGYVTVAPVKSPSRLQRIARAITRLFRK